MSTLTEIKLSSISKRKLFQIERTIVREATDLWYLNHTFYSENFSGNVHVFFRSGKTHVEFTEKELMLQGDPESTVNEFVKGLTLTMAVNPATGDLLDNYEDIIGNILDIFVHRLNELGDRKFILERLQSLELGFSLVLGLKRNFSGLKKVRRQIVDILTNASLLSPGESAEILINDILGTEYTAQTNKGVTFHIIMEGENHASFISLPFGIAQSDYVSLLGNHTLRCNIIIDKITEHRYINSGILKIDAPSNPAAFVSHKGFGFSINNTLLIKKLSSETDIKGDKFTPDELSTIRLLFNEYVLLACFLLKSRAIDPSLKLLFIFPKANLFRILNEENPRIPVEEPPKLGDLAALHPNLFKLKKERPTKSRKVKSSRIPERVIQEKTNRAVRAFAKNILESIYKPVSDIKRKSVYFRQHSFTAEYISEIYDLVGNISSFLKKLNNIQQVVIDEGSNSLNIEQSVETRDLQTRPAAIEEIVQSIQTEEVEQFRDVIVYKMLNYLSIITLKLDQVSQVSSPYIKEEIMKEVEAESLKILHQAKSFYRLLRKNI